MLDIDQRSIRFTNGRVYRFPEDIAETLDFEESIVVRLDHNSVLNAENIFALDYTGQLLWKIPAPHTFHPMRPYVAVFRKDGCVEALSWEGHVLVVHPKAGFIVGEGFYAGGFSEAHRKPSARRWL